MKGEYKSANKMYAELSWGNRRYRCAHKNVIEVRVDDDHQQEVALIELRRQPDNTIVLKIWGTDDDPLYEAIIKRGADVVRREVRAKTKGEVPDLTIAPGAPGRRKPKEKSG